jgi:hypothetical protein
MAGGTCGKRGESSVGMARRSQSIPTQIKFCFPDVFYMLCFPFGTQAIRFDPDQTLITCRARPCGAVKEWFELIWQCRYM